MSEHDRVDSSSAEGEPERSATGAEGVARTPTGAQRGPLKAADHVLWLQRAAGNTATTQMLGRDPAPAELPEPTRARMGQAFGEDLSTVRVHEDSPRATGDRRAVTEGADVHFAAGAYAPGTKGGDWLLAHELSHVLQQRHEPPIPGVEATAAATEREADAAADAAMEGRSANVSLSAAPGVLQAYEATEHTDLGNVAGGDQITVVTTTGVRLTYGEIVALSGDFYRSPEAVMNAPADELRKILEVMKFEREKMAELGGTLDRAASAEINKRYEAATSTSERAKHHDHSSLGDDHDHGHEGEHDEDEDEHDHDEDEHDHDMDADEEAEDEEAVHSGKKKRRMTKYGPMVGDEHVEDAGEPQAGVKAGDKPSASGSFLDLADENSSHFSPENIRLNFKPKHLMAMDLGREAWMKRNPGKKAPDMPTGGEPGAEAKARGEAAEPGAAPSARMGTTPTPEGAAPTGADPTKGPTGPAATPTHVRGAGGNPGEQEEARALMVSAFAAHFLTDAFAGGHLVSGVEARKRAPKWFEDHRGDLETKVKSLLKRDNKEWSDIRLTLTAKALLSLVAGSIGGIMLKLVHDKYNKEGVRVKNAKGTVWETTGDANLAKSAQTIAQAELATKAARDAVQECIAEGKTDKPYEALDYVPDTAQLGTGGWRPIEVVAKDTSVFDKVWNEKMLAGTESGEFYDLLMSYKTSIPGLAGSMLKLKVLKGVESVKSKYRDIKKKLGKTWRKAKKFLGDNVEKLKDWGSEKLEQLKSWGADKWEKAKELGSGALDTIKDVGSGISDWFGDKWSKAKELGSGVIDTVKDVGSGAAEWAGEKWDSAKSVAGNLWGSIKSWGSDQISKVKEAAGGAADWIGNAVDVAKKWGADKVDALVEGAKGIASKIAGGSKEIADKVVELFRGARRKVAGWAAEKADELGGGPGKEGTAPSETGRVSEVQNQTYAHGGFMGAAGAFMHDPTWSAIFRTLMATEYERVSKIAEPEKLMLALENNPVLAAYGSARHLKDVAAKSDARPDAGHKALPLEWDVWLPPDPAQITDLGAVKIAHGNLGTTVGQGIAGDDPVGYARDDVKNAPSGGEWMQLFGKAIAMYRGTASGQPVTSKEEGEKRDEQLKKLAKGTSADEAVQIAKEFLGANGGLILDVKSTYSTPEHIATFVKFLKGQGLNVFGVGTFKPEQLRDLDPDVRKVKFFHGLNDLERAAAGMHAGGALKKGDDVMFNAGSLLSEGREYLVAGDKTYSIDQGAYQRLVAIQRSLSLNIGLYVQESAIAPDAVQRITELVNKNPGVFTRGFAYGNVSGEAEAEVAGTGMGAQKWMNW